MHETVETATTIHLYGSAFLPALMTPKAVYVDGDLITPHVACPRLGVRRGSLLAPRIDCPLLYAEILGVFDLSQAFAAPAGWSYQWLRPVTLLPDDVPPSSEDSIDRVIALFRTDALVADPIRARTLIDRATQRKTCMRARVLFGVALEELADSPTALTPLGRQVAGCLLASERLPDHWRH